MKRIYTIITLLILCFANVQAQKILKPMWSTAHVGTAAHFNNSGTKVLTCGGNGIDVWDNKADTLLYTFSNSTLLTDAIFSNDGTKIAASTVYGTILIIEAEQGTLLDTFYIGKESSTKVVFSKNDDLLFAYPSNDNIASVWSVKKGELVSRFSTEKNEIRGGSFSGDGTLILLYYSDNAEIFDTYTGKKVKTLDHSRHIVNAEFDNTNKYIITASNSSGIKIWDIKTFTEMYHISDIPYISLATFSADGAYFCHASNNSEITIRNTITGEKVSSLKGSNLIKQKSVRFNKSGEYIVSTEYDGTAKLWNVKTGELSHIFSLKDKHGADNCEFEQNGKRFLTVSSDGVVTIFDTTIKETVKEYCGYSRINTYPIFSRSEKRIIASSDDNTVKVWNAESGKLELIDFQFPLDGRPNKVQHCSNNTFVSSIAFGHDRIRDMDTLGIVYNLPNLPNIPQFLPNCTQIIYRNSTSTGYEVYDLGKGSVTKKIEHDQYVDSRFCISPQNDFITSFNYNKVYTWSYNSGLLLNTVEVTTMIATFAEFVDNKTVLIQSIALGELMWIDVEQGKIIRTYTSPQLYRRATLSNDKSKIILIANYKILKILDARTGTLLREVHLQKNILSADISSDNSLLLTTEEGVLTLYNFATMRKIAQSAGYANIKNGAFNKSADRIVTTDNDGTIRMWNALVEIDPSENNTSIFLSPNPATDEITIKGISSASSITYTFTDIIGNTIHRGFIPEQTSTYTLSTQHLPSGFYNVTFQMNGTKHTEKLTVVH